MYMRMTKTIHSSWLCVYYLFGGSAHEFAFITFLLVCFGPLAVLWQSCIFFSSSHSSFFLYVISSFALISFCYFLSIGCPMQNVLLCFNFFSFCNVSRSRHARRLIYERKEEKLLRLSCAYFSLSLFVTRLSCRAWEMSETTQQQQKPWIKRNENTNGGDTFFGKAHSNNRQTPLCNARKMIDCGRMDSKRLSKEEKKRKIEK